MGVDGGSKFRGMLGAAGTGGAGGTGGKNYNLNFNLDEE